MIQHYKDEFFSLICRENSCPALKATHHEFRAYPGSVFIYSRIFHSVTCFFKLNMYFESYVKSLLLRLNFFIVACNVRDLNSF